MTCHAPTLLQSNLMPPAGFTAVQHKQTDPIFAETYFLYLRHPHGKEPLTIKVRLTAGAVQGKQGKNDCVGVQAIARGGTSSLWGRQLLTMRDSPGLCSIGVLSASRCASPGHVRMMLCT